MLSRVFPRLAPVICICFEFWLFHCAVYVCCGWSALDSDVALVLRHQMKTTLTGTFSWGLDRYHFFKSFRYEYDIYRYLAFFDIDIDIDIVILYCNKWLYLRPTRTLSKLFMVCKHYTKTHNPGNSVSTLCDTFFELTSVQQHIYTQTEKHWFPASNIQVSGHVISIVRDRSRRYF